MKPLFRNIFMLFGIASVVVMLFAFEGGYEQIKENILSAGLFLPAVIGIWGIIYLCESRAFQLIVNSGHQSKCMHFRYAYKLTVSGFAFSCTTPFGLGGSPYRMMEMSKFVGVPRAMSNVVLYSMMQILSQFLLWTTGVIVFVIADNDKMTSVLWAIFFSFIVVLIAALCVFNYGYKNGLIEKLYCMLVLRIPFVKKPLQKFYDNKKMVMQQVDKHTSYLREQPHAFWGSLAYEYLARLIQTFEFLLILLAFGMPVNYADALLVLAFSSLMGNVLFFFPMQLGAREGGVALIVDLLGIASSGVGVFVSFYTRIREIFWIIIGVSLLNVGNNKIMSDIDSSEITDVGECGK